MSGEEIVYWENHSSFQPSRIFLNIKYYPDGMPLINEWPVGKVFKVLLRPKSLQGFVAGIFFVQALIDRGHPVEKLILPFVPGSRQDRMNDKGDYLFTAKYIAKLVNDLFLDVTIVDPHSDVTPALIERCKVIKIKDIINDAINPHTFNYDFVIAPDAGAAKRAQEVADLMGLPLLVANKVRDISTGNIIKYDMPARLSSFKKVLVVDDICDGGATFLKLRDSIHNSIETDLFVTHGLFTRGTHELTSKYRHVFTTDTTIADRPNVKVYQFCENL